MRVLLLVKYDLVLRYEARVNALRASSFSMHEHKLYKFAYFVPLNHGKYFFEKDIEKGFSIVSVKWIHFYFTVNLNEMSILRTVITWEFSTF